MFKILWYMIVAIVFCIGFMFQGIIASFIGCTPQGVADSLCAAAICSLLGFAIGFPYREIILRPWFAFRKPKKHKFATNDERTEIGPELECEYFFNTDKLKFHLGLFLRFPEGVGEHYDILRSTYPKRLEIENVIKFNKNEGGDWFLLADQKFGRQQRQIDVRPKNAKAKGLLYLKSDTVNQTEASTVGSKKELIDFLEPLIIEFIDPKSGKERIVKYPITKPHELNSDEYGGFITNIMEDE